MQGKASSKHTKGSANRLAHFRDLVARLLAAFGVKVFPAFLVTISVLAFAWQYVYSDSPEGAVLPIRVWESPSAQQSSTQVEAIDQLGKINPQPFIDTELSTKEFWFSLEANKPRDAQAWAVEFPSRHAVQLTCWDQHGAALLGAANRSNALGGMTKSRSGFAVIFPASQQSAVILCTGTFRGPARISAKVWSSDVLEVASSDYSKTGSMIEAGIGVLALFMLLTAIVNRSLLYWAFVGWLLLNMRMAALSAGTDFEFFNFVIDSNFLVLSRQWTVCMYYTTTVALFSTLFVDELNEIKATWPLLLHQIAAVAIIAACPFLSFESTLPILWVITVTVAAVMIYYLYKILRRTHSRVAVWYAASILVSLVASLNEVAAAAIGERTLIVGLNSVTAALASALLTSAAVAEHIRTDRLLKLKAQQTLEQAYNDSPVGLFTLSDGDLIAKSNIAFRTLFKGVHPAKTTRLSHLFAPHVHREINALRQSVSRTSIDIQTQTHKDHTGDEKDRWFAITASTIDGNIVEGSLQDITEKVLATTRLEFLANHDPLTECLNLRGIARTFERAAQQPTALAYFDLDRFKLINDLYGHSAGDAVLKQVCERMKTQLGPEDLLARVGGDEFVVAFPRSTIAQASERCHGIVTLISSKPYLIETQSFALSVSGGLVETARFGKSPLKEIVSAADTVCRIAKKRTTERLVVMESGSTFFKHHKEELELITCLERGETPKGLFLVMQPEISLTRPFDSLNFEVLLRMRKPNGETVPAAVIVEAAEAHGKSAIIDRWVVTTVIAWLEKHASELPNTRFVGVNLSGGSLNDEIFTEELFELFSLHQAALSMICLEITETVALTDMRNMQRFIDRARAMGAKVGLDDFGAGYSSFGYLKGLSVDALKLDGSLVLGASRSPASMAIISAIGGLVKNLGMKSIGEFAEDLPTIKALVAAGIDYAQGYGISKPVLPEKILAARSAADFVEDKEILAYIKQLQDQTDLTSQLFDDTKKAPQIH